jgi:hypothetical protein
MVPAAPSVGEIFAGTAIPGAVRRGRRGSLHRRGCGSLAAEVQAAEHAREIAVGPQLACKRPDGTRRRQSESGAAP